jgi:hypothetical protein
MDESDPKANHKNQDYSILVIMKENSRLAVFPKRSAEPWFSKKNKGIWENRWDICFRRIFSNRWINTLKQ